jgi:hypothetical protein
MLLTSYTRAGGMGAEVVDGRHFTHQKLRLLFLDKVNFRIKLTFYGYEISLIIDWDFLWLGDTVMDQRQVSIGDVFSYHHIARRHLPLLFAVTGIALSEFGIMIGRLILGAIVR